MWKICLTLVKRGGKVDRKKEGKGQAISPEVGVGRHIFLKQIWGLEILKWPIFIIIIINNLTLFCISLSILVGFSDPWSGHSSVIPWIGAWSSRGCCHGNCQGNSRKGRDDCLDWRVLDGKVGSTLQSWLSGSGYMWQTEAFGTGPQQIPNLGKPPHWLSNQICLSSACWQLNRKADSCTVVCRSRWTGVRMQKQFLDGQIYNCGSNFWTFFLGFRNDCTCSPNVWSLWANQDSCISDFGCYSPLQMLCYWFSHWANSQLNVPNQWSKDDIIQPRPPFPAWSVEKGVSLNNATYC